MDAENEFEESFNKIVSDILASEQRSDENDEQPPSYVIDLRNYYEPEKVRVVINLCCDDEEIASPIGVIANTQAIRKSIVEPSGEQQNNSAA